MSEDALYETARALADRGMDYGSSPQPNLGRTATVVFDHENGEPRTVNEQIKDEWPNVGVGYLDDISIVSIWSFQAALYALQNPTPDNITRALTLIAQSGDCEEWVDGETLEVLPVAEPDGWLS